MSALPKPEAPVSLGSQAAWGAYADIRGARGQDHPPRSTDGRPRHDHHGHRSPAGLAPGNPQRPAAVPGAD